MIPLTWAVLSDGYTTAPEAIVRPSGSWFRRIRFNATAFLLHHPHRGAVLVDCGYSLRFLQETAQGSGRLYRMITPVTLTHEGGIKQCLEALGVRADCIQHVFITHFHGDHIGGLHDFPNATVYSTQTAWAFASRLQGLQAVRHGILPGLIPRDLASRLKFVSEGEDAFGDGSLTVRELPGHAVGQMGLEFHTATHPVLLAADACWVSDAFRNNSPPHGVTRLLHHWQAYKATLAKLHRWHCERPELLIVPSHCPETANRIIP